NHHQQCLPGRNADDDAGRFPGICHRRVQLTTEELERAMRFNLKATLRTTALAVLVLLLGASWAVAQQQINLTAGPTSITLPDGAAVPMWGYSCGTVVVGSTATCAKSNPTAAGWSPVVITVPTGESLRINLTNSLIFGAN